MAYATATPDQQARVHNFVHMLRAVVIHVWQHSNNTTALIQNWNSDILGIIGTPQGVTINDASPYPGAVPLTDTQVSNLYSIMQTIQTNNMTSANKDIFMLATGPVNAALT